MSFTNSFTSFFLSNLDDFLSCLTAVTRTSNTMLNKSGKSAHPSLLTDSTGKTICFSTLSMMLAIGLSNVAFIMLRYIPSIPGLLSFNHKWMLNFTECFFCIIEMIIWFLPVILLIWYYHTD